MTVAEAITCLEEKLGKDFFFKKESVDLNRRIDLQLTSAGLEEVVRQVFGHNYTYTLIDNMIVITFHDAVVPVEGKIVRGTVRSHEGEPLPGVTVMIKGITLGVTTDTDGRFQLTIPDHKEIVLVFSFVGMKRKKLCGKVKKN